MSDIVPFDVLSAEDARRMWRSSPVRSSREINAALEDINSFIEYDAARGECDTIIKDWRRVVPDGVLRNYVIRILQDMDYVVIKSGSRLIIEWRKPVPDDDVDSDAE